VSLTRLENAPGPTNLSRTLLALRTSHEGSGTPCRARTSSGAQCIHFATRRRHVFTPRPFLSYTLPAHALLRADRPPTCAAHGCHCRRHHGTLWRTRQRHHSLLGELAVEAKRPLSASPRSAGIFPTGTLVITPTPDPSFPPSVRLCLRALRALRASLLSCPSFARQRVHKRRHPNRPAGSQCPRSREAPPSRMHAH
jgi:hypothetical protein